MEIYLIRHTTPDIPKDVCYGQSDIGLTSTFREESAEVLRKLPPTLDVVYTSPLSRCLQLADLIPHHELIQVPELKEMNFGDWELKPWADIPQAALNPWMEDFVHQQVPHGESMEQLANRVVSWYHRLMSSPIERLAVITHAGPIRIILSEINQTPLIEAFDRYPVSYGEVIRV